MIYLGFVFNLLGLNWTLSESTHSLQRSNALFIEVKGPLKLPSDLRNRLDNSLARQRVKTSRRRYAKQGRKKGAYE